MSTPPALLLSPEPVDLSALLHAMEAMHIPIHVQTYAEDSAPPPPDLHDAPPPVAVIACRRVRPEPGELRSSLEQVLPYIEATQQHGFCPIILVGDHRNSADFIDALRIPHITHIIPWSDPQARRQVVVAVSKFFTPNIWGLERYLRRQEEIPELVVTSSTQRDKVLDTLAEYLAPFNVNRRLVALAQSVSDEFLMNAVYNAPIDPEGKRPFASLSRTESVELDRKDAALFRYFCDGERLYISIFDRFGSLSPDTVRSYLIRCLERGDDQIEYKDGGAGLGMYTILESVNRWVLNIVPGRGTEMIGVLGVHRSYRKFLELPKSLHIFTSNSPDIYTFEV